jgi:23S rRNA-/tRNA-specific pseudouridylate synthase
MPHSFLSLLFLSLSLLLTGAAVGHPIVRDTVYGYQGSAAPNGGLDESELPKDRADVELQKALAEATRNSDMCVHAKLIRFRHPTTGEVVEFTSTPGF